MRLTPGSPGLCLRQQSTLELHVLCNKGISMGRMESALLPLVAASNQREYLWIDGEWAGVRIHFAAFVEFAVIGENSIHTEADDIQVFAVLGEFGDDKLGSYSIGVEMPPYFEYLVSCAKRSVAGMVAWNSRPYGRNKEQTSGEDYPGGADFCGNSWQACGYQPMRRGSR